VKTDAPKVLNKKQLRAPVPDAVYIGRPSICGNPFVIGRDGTRADVIAKYESWLAQQPRLRRNSIAFAAVISFAGARHCHATATCCCGWRTHRSCAATECSHHQQYEWLVRMGTLGIQKSGENAPPPIVPL